MYAASYMYHCNSYHIMILYSVVIDDNSSDSNLIDNHQMFISLAALLAISVIGLVTSMVINAFLVVRLKKSRCVVTSIHSMYSYVVDYLLQI